MDDTEILDSYKIEIRSILLPFKNGCYLSEFNSTYFSMIGKRLPFREMGFKTDIEFLYSMPDVVKITPAGRNIYHLMGVADEKSKHIQKMVAKQKPGKLKTRPPLPRISRPPRFSTFLPPPRFDNLPPRFTETRKTQDLSLRPQTSSKRPESPPVALPKVELKLPSKATPMEEVIALIRHLKNRLAIDDVLCEYKRMYNKSLSLSTYGFSSIEECINEIKELEIIENNNVKFVRICSEKQAASNKDDKKDESSLKGPLLDTPSSDNSEYIYNKNCDNGNIPASLREKLLKVAATCTNGIFASDFPRYFEEVTGHALEFDCLGYRCLNDFIDDVPDIFIRKPVAGSRKDCLIYSARNFKVGQKETVDYESPLKRIALNLRRILEAYPEGIKLQELTNVYSFNCKDSFHIQDFGFDDLEKFLSSIKSDVPLKFNSVNGVKSVCLIKLAETPNNLVYMAPEAYNREAIPFDAAFPEFKYKPHTFPADFDFSTFTPAYTSSVAHAGKLYLQFTKNPGSSDELAKLGTELDNFYNGSQSDQYIMKTIHIEVGASCIAKWPADNHWYRAQILQIPSMQCVRVIYVDYGTTDTIPKFLLRYAKREFIDLPVQAVRCQLAFLKPPKNAPKWDIQTRHRILKLCQDVPLMAKIEEIEPNGTYSVLLCDTNGEDDIYINDVLIKEGLAEPAESNLAAPEPKLQTEALPSLHPLQALQAQFYLQAFAAVAPVFSQNELYLGLLKEVTALCKNSDPVSQNMSMQFTQPVVPPGFNTIPPGINSFANSSALYNLIPSAASAFETNSVRKTKANTILPPKDFYSTSVASSSALPASHEIFPDENRDNENEIFDDDDDEMFQQFIQKVSLTNTRHVKRVMLGDGYKIHIIVYNSQPYASSGEISLLIWNNKEADYLLCRLQLKEADSPLISVSEDGNEQLFQQLLKFNVKGVQKTKGFKSSIYLYPLRYVMRILNIFGHPSVTLRTRLTEEIANFNPNDQYWKENVEFFADSVESENEDSLSGIVYSSATDDDKIEKLCLYDLLAMKESIVCKKKKMLSSSDLSKSTDEIDKIERLLQKVLNRIKEIKEICQVFHNVV